MFRSFIISLYHGASNRSVAFRFSMLAFDILAVIFFVVTSMLPDAPWIQNVDFALAGVIGLDFLLRFWIAPNHSVFMKRFSTWADLVVIFALVAPVLSDELLFLRVLRALRLMRSYHVLADLRKRNSFFRQNEEVVQSVINLGVFIFTITALVYVAQHRINPQITNYIDALYFTVATLTTTGFGDITLSGTGGRLLAIVIMVVGVGLFLRLVQTIFRPAKVRHTCGECGLTRHDLDAVHCKHCGDPIKIKTEGA